MVFETIKFYFFVVSFKWELIKNSSKARASKTTKRRVEYQNAKWQHAIRKQRTGRQIERITEKRSNPLRT